MKKGEMSIKEMDRFCQFHGKAIRYSGGLWHGFMADKYPKPTIYMSQNKKIYKVDKYTKTEKV